VIIATPGRLRDLLQNGYMVLNQCSWLIIDEADKMIDFGFEEDLSFILSCMPKDFEGHARVTHMFSATMSLEVEKMARQYLHNNIYVSIGEPG